MITSDIETIQQDGIDAVREVETAYKIVKKNDEELEVPDGLKGRILPFGLVQQLKFQTEIQSIKALQSRIESICCELDELHDNFTEEETEVYCDSEKDNVFDKKAIKADAKPKADVESETKAKLQQIVKLWDEQSIINKQIKVERQNLVDKTVDAINHLSDDEVARFLHLKWIVPVCYDIKGTLTAVLSELESLVQKLGDKYSVSYKQINNEINSAKEELSMLVSELTGDEFSIKGLEELIKI